MAHAARHPDLFLLRRFWAPKKSKHSEFYSKVYILKAKDLLKQIKSLKQITFKRFCAHKIYWHHIASHPRRRRRGSFRRHVGHVASHAHDGRLVDDAVTGAEAGAFCLLAFVGDVGAGVQLPSENVLDLWDEKNKTPKTTFLEDTWVWKAPAFDIFDSTF